MPSLIEALNRSTAQPLTTPATQPSVLGNQSLVQTIGGATSGKAAATPAGPARSSLGEQVQNQALQQGVRDVEQQKQAKQVEQVQAAQQVETEATLNDAQLDEQKLAQRTAMLQKQQDILQEFTQGSRQLDLNKDKAKMEQLGFNMRLSNDQYVKRLNDEAARARLNDAVQFDEALKRSLWADEEELLRDDFDFRALLSADDRAFKEQLSTMDLEMAIQLATATNKQANMESIWSGVSSTVSGGIQAYGIDKQYTAPNSDAFAAKPAAAASSSAVQTPSNFEIGGGFTPDTSVLPKQPTKFEPTR